MCRVYDGIIAGCLDRGGVQSESDHDDVIKDINSRHSVGKNMNLEGNLVKIGQIKINGVSRNLQIRDTNRSLSF